MREGVEHLALEGLSRLGVVPRAGSARKRERSGYMRTRCP